ncbi:MAG: Trp biosynthesis-associated membrane protein [Frankiaceae bacterium]|jgi:uncharacterized membrane protein (TIGR02234 family)|nr:Trp biosynthesis-associated membrane protein [Frankiaceae bacterium]
MTAQPGDRAAAAARTDPAGAARAARAARGERAAACAALAAGALAALGASSRTWLSITAARPAPLPPVRLAISGRSLSPAAGGLALALLAGALAVLATSGRARQALGAALAALSAALIAVAASAATGVSDEAARRLLGERFSGIGLAGPYPVQARAHPGWSWLCAGGAALCLLGAAAVLVRGGRWAAMAARYGRAEPAQPGAGARRGADGADGAAAADGPAPAGDSRAGAAGSGAADLALWTALDRGDDPTGN